MGKKTPIRKCVACGARRPKSELIRVVYNKNNKQVCLDKDRKMSGRGAYICPDKDCLLKARKANKFSRALKISISDEIYNHLMEEIGIMDD